MKRTVNFKAVLIVTVVVALSGVAVHFVHGYQVSRHSRELLEQAKQAERDGQLEEVANCLAEYLGLTPDDIEAQCKYALVSKDLAKTRRQKLRAYYVLENVLRRYSDRNDLRRAAAELGLQFGRFEDSRKYLDALYQASPKDADLAFLLGRCELGAFNNDKATRWLVLATELAPERIALSLDVAAALRFKRLDRPSVANEVIDNLATRGRPAHEAREAAARYFAQHAEWARAEPHVQAALAGMASPSADLLVLAAEVQQRLGRRAEARQHLERGLSLFPKDTRLSQRLAQIDLIDGQREQAKARMATVPQEKIERPEEVLQAAELLIELGEMDRARELIVKLEAARAIAPALMLRGRLLMKKGNWGPARIELEKARATAGDPGLAKILHVWLGECYERLGCVDQAQAAYRQALTFDRSWNPARRGLAEVLVAMGQVDRAIDEYRILVAESPEFRTELARLLLAKNQMRPTAERDYSEIDEIIRTTPQSDKPVPGLVLVKAELLFAKGKTDEARKLVEAERDRDPSQLATWLLLVSLATRSGSGDGALAVLAEAETRLGPKVEFELTKAHLGLGAAKIEASALLRTLEPKVEKLKGADAVRMLAGLAEMYVNAGDMPAAQRLWRQITDRSPDNLTARFALFEVALQAGADAEIEKCLAELRRIEGANGPLAAYGDAARHVASAMRGDKAAIAAARGPLAQAAELSPTWTRVVALQGQVFDIDGLADKALEKYLEAIDRGDSRLLIVRRVLQLLYQQRRYAEANTLVRRISKQSLSGTDLGRIAAQLWVVSPLDEGTDAKVVRQRALELARQSVKAESRDYREYLWLGQVAALADQPAEAEKAFRHAKQLEPASPDAWVMLLSFLAKADPKRADAELEVARQTLSQDQLPIVLAPCLEAIGRIKEADEQYKAALVARPNDLSVLRSAANFFALSGQSDQALPVLRKLIDPTARAPEATLTWARRTLAMSVAASGDYQQYREALALIEANGTAALIDRLAKAIILAMQPANRREAIRLFEEISPQLDTVHADVRFVAAQLYEADGHWPKARAHLQALITEHDKNPTYLARYIRGLLRHDGAEEAVKLVDKLIALRPDAYESVELNARVRKAQGRPLVETVELVRAYARAKASRPELAASLLEELGATAEAETLFRQLAGSSPRPEATLLLAGFLSRHDRLAESLNLMERAWATCSPEAVASSCVAALRAGKGTAAHYRQVDEWINAAIAKDPKSTMLPTILAMMYESCDRTTDAVERYRQVLQQDARNVVALNNLACLLAARESQTAEALALINRAIDLAGPDAELLDSRALIYLRAGQAEPALVDIQQAIAQVSAPSKKIYFRLGQIQNANKNRTAAIEAMNKAKKLGLKAADLTESERSVYQKLVSDLKLD